MTTPRIFVSVIIPTYNDNSQLKRCLDALAIQTYPQTAFEVIVIDNGSDNPPADLVNGYDNTKFLQEAKKGSYAARNTGIDASTGDIFAFIDSDCIPSADWIAQGVHQLQQTDQLTVIGGEVDVFYQDDSAPTPIELYETLFAFPIETNIQNKHYPPTGNMFVPRPVLEKVGNFNDALKSGGDFEWGNRAYEAGITLVYSREITVLHPARRTFDQYRNKTQRIAGGQVIRAKQDTSKPFFLHRIFYYDFLPPLGATKQLIQSNQLHPIQKLKVFGVILWLRTVTVREKIALVFGLKEPVR